jgi:hypothetical protein
MSYKILIVEDVGKRINTFIESLGHHDIKIVDTITEARLCLSHIKYDYLFLTSKVGEEKEPCSDLVNFIVKELTYRPFIILHTLDIITVEEIKKIIPEISWKPIGSAEFFSMSLIS